MRDNVVLTIVLGGVQQQILSIFLLSENRILGSLKHIERYVFRVFCIDFVVIKHFTGTV